MVSPPPLLSRRRDNTDETRPEWRTFGQLEEVYPEWLIDQVLPQDSLICLFGRRGLGKTFLALDLACSVVSGRPWLKRHQVRKRGNVAYVLAERPEGLRRRMLGWLYSQGLSEHDKDVLESDEGRLFVTRHRFAIDQEGGRKELCRELATLAPLSLIVLDPLVFFMDGSENDTRDMQALIEGLLSVATDQKCTILLVHHEGKGRGNRGARGSSALEAGVDTVLRLSGQTSSPFAELTVTKQRDFKEPGPFFLEFKDFRDKDRDLGQFPVQRPPQRPAASLSPEAPSSPPGATAQAANRRPVRDANNAAQRQAILAAVEQAETNGASSTVKTIRQSTKLGDSPIRRHLANLVEEGVLAVQKDSSAKNLLRYRSADPKAQPTTGATPSTDHASIITTTGNSG